MKKTASLLLVIFFFLIGEINISRSQYIFDPNYVHTFEINFYDSNWDYLLDSMATAQVGTGSGTGRILADVIINGIQYDSCGVRYKGNSSMDTASYKNPYNIDLNWAVAGQEHQGKDKFKLANCFSDPSMVREVLMYEISNQYMDCPRASFCKVFINGDYVGVYTNTESIDNEFLDQHYGDSDNAFFKCDPISFQIFGDNSNLSYYADSMAYDTLYDMKSLYGLGELQAFCNELNNNPGNIENVLDVDRALWFLAVSSAFVHNDGYTAFAHNYYIYKMTNGKWSIILWDVNMAFGGLPWNGATLATLDENDMINQDPFLHINSPNFRPLISKLLSNPMYKRMYVAHMKTILSENVSNDYYLQRAESWQQQIDTIVTYEPYPQYTYQQFQDNLYTSIGSWLGFRAGLESLMSGRLTYLNGLPEFQALQPTISNINAPSSPDPFSSVSITAEVTDANDVYLGYRYGEFESFNKVLMYDDGAHNDGASGDGIYGTSIWVNALEVDYFIYAENANAGKFSPVRAEYEFYTLTPKKGLVINEISALNVSIAQDLAGQYDDWIELYNNSDQAVLLDDYYFSDHPDTLQKWTIPFTNFYLNSGEYFIIWADNDLLQSGVHANFKLNSNGEGLYMSNSTGEIIDQLIYPQQQIDISYGRFPNGTGNFNYLIPTFGAENSQLAGQSESINKNEFIIYPNPVKDNLTISTNTDNPLDIEVYNLLGQIVMTSKTQGPTTTLNVESLKSGNYIIRIPGIGAQQLVKQ
ncbi:CotH kinase family protein [Paracrocinitomix mangrovi]|uniref:CotH kinase family protein n=1 Tax=Paracrocinitomix mangrovi TaxID=2862509 RepID=UPI001C8E039E|nr:CotH kinase family protein [Paracrocinitomix mangrovi]UKN00108.1 CotH kinase family protein [Paracrocinitomix mangrovi]